MRAISDPMLGERNSSAEIFCINSTSATIALFQNGKPIDFVIECEWNGYASIHNARWKSNIDLEDEELFEENLELQSHASNKFQTKEVETLSIARSYFEEEEVSVNVIKTSISNLTNWFRDKLNPINQDEIFSYYEAMYDPFEGMEDPSLADRHEEEVDDDGYEYEVNWHYEEEINIPEDPDTHEYWERLMLDHDGIERHSEELAERESDREAFREGLRGKDVEPPEKSELVKPDEIDLSELAEKCAKLAVAAVMYVRKIRRLNGLSCSEVDHPIIRKGSDLSSLKSLEGGLEEDMPW